MPVSLQLSSDQCMHVKKPTQGQGEKATLNPDKNPSANQGKGELNLIKNMCEKNLALHIIINGERIISPYNQSQDRDICSYFYSALYQWFQLMQLIQKNKNNYIQIGKSEIKLSLFVVGLIVYVENLMEFTKKKKEPINEFGKIMGYKINIQN